MLFDKLEETNSLKDTNHLSLLPPPKKKKNNLNSIPNKMAVSSKNTPVPDDFMAEFYKIFKEEVILKYSQTITNIQENKEEGNFIAYNA